MDRKGYIMNVMAHQLEILFQQTAHSEPVDDFDFAVRDDIRPMLADWALAQDFVKRNGNGGDKLGQQLQTLQQLMRSLADKIKQEFDPIIGQRVRQSPAIYPATRLTEIFRTASYTIGPDLLKPYEPDFAQTQAEYVGNMGSAMNWALDRHLELLLAPGVGRPIPAYLQQFRRYWNQHIQAIQSVCYN
ncbi:uncharacterized protein LOC128953215 [Oppia nitens]|uniref:uncharacterized protein LOC128953215 n=1 Tax=Oppia nitens TaxID=1686743 RepID=UPI0023DA1FF6|nr:uncharacterized protein LOC128953215 [Oppia nitens]